MFSYERETDRYNGKKGTRVIMLNYRLVNRALRVSSMFHACGRFIEYLEIGIVPVIHTYTDI